MVFQGCSDVVESRLEHPILDAESRGNAAFTSDSEQPRRASPLGDARTSDNDSLCRADLSINKFGDVSIDCDQHQQGETGLPKISHHLVDNKRCANRHSWISIKTSLRSIFVYW